MNFCQAGLKTKVIMVLIDTWWNVNDIIYCFAASAFGFNRYMVECESVFLTKKDETYKVLIDTWWNVNEFRATLTTSNNAVLIDTWWNVNEPFV